MDELRRELLVCRELLESAVRRLTEMPVERKCLEFEVPEEKDEFSYGAD
jgi:hypothetical protein